MTIPLTPDATRLPLNTRRATSTFGMPDIATTRRSATDHSLPPNEPQFAVPLDAALRHATFDSAASFDADSRVGRMQPGMYADLVVLDGDVLDGGNLLAVSVVRTIVGGKTVFEKETEETDV
ncbi:MAG: amidohydrolase family protein [Rhodococcus sp. (in: high G+C Gram-positive bacteria)]